MKNDNDLTWENFKLGMTDTWLDSIGEFLFGKIPQIFYWTPRSHYARISRMVWWAWKLRDSYDWDFGYVYEINQLKLERMIREFRTNGHCVWNTQNPPSKEFKRLLEAAELAKRLHHPDDENDHVSQVYESFKDKDAPTDSWSSKFFSEYYLDAKPIDTKLYRHIQKKARAKDKARQDATRRRYYHLLEKYGERWWD